MSGDSKCCDCGAVIEEGEVYGDEWDDLCRECHFERKEDEDE